MLLELAYVGNVSDKLLNDGSTQNTTLDNINSLPIGALFGPQPNTRPDLLGTATRQQRTGNLHRRRRLLRRRASSTP